MDAGVLLSISPRFILSVFLDTFLDGIPAKVRCELHFMRSRMDFSLE